MSVQPEPTNRIRPERPGRRNAGRLLALLVALAVAFAIGVALGEALHDNPKPGSTQTTLRPLTVTVAPETVTITTSSP
ncbi:MAG: hypothetical protein WBB74_07730 [Gaiellaceae bacterium]